MSALTILIIRHAEKPKELWPGPGLEETGSKEKASLVVRGWQRAGAWAALFGAGLGGETFPQPTVIYAADPKSADTGEPSQRPMETVSPLTERLGLKPVLTYAVGQEVALVSQITSLTGCVLVCWEHKAIARTLLPAIAGSETLPGLPTKWGSLRFDVVLRFDRAAPGQPWSFRQLFPRLLSGDSDKPME